MRTRLLVTAAVLGLSAPLLFAGDHPVVKKEDAQRDLLLMYRCTGLSSRGCDSLMLRFAPVVQRRAQR